MSVMPQNLRNAADYMQKVSGVDPTWLREAADEMERLRSIAAERMALFHQAATKVEQLSEQLVKAVADERERCAKICDGWVAEFGNGSIQYVPATEYATDAVCDIADLIRNPKVTQSDD